MTKLEFIDNVTTWDELLEFCRDTGCDTCDYIIGADSLDEYINEDLRYAVNNGENWTEIYGWLTDINASYSYYRVNGSFDYEPVDTDRDFVCYKDDVFGWADENNIWDEEYDGEEEEPEPDENDEPEEPPVEEEDFSVADLMSMCSSDLLTIRQDAEHRRKELNDAVEELLFSS